MTVTYSGPLIASPDAAAKAAFVAGLRMLADFHETHPDAPLPTGHLNIPVPLRDKDGDRLPRSVRLAMLHEIAAAHGLSAPGSDGMGSTVAYRFYGPVQVEAHVGGEVMRHDTYVATARALRAAQAGTEAAA